MPALMSIPSSMYNAVLYCINEAKRISETRCRRQGIQGSAASVVRTVTVLSRPSSLCVDSNGRTDPWMIRDAPVKQVQVDWERETSGCRTRMREVAQRTDRLIPRRCSSQQQVQHGHR